MTKRKTINVADVQQWIEERLLSDHLSTEHKRGMINVLDHILHQTDNYKGFGYSYMDDERPCLPGKVGAEACNPNWTEEHEVRRHYYN